ncbi:hypothetical protein HK098_000167 [Nowakowskiella sp. JEL0407]|nr:hypothetical protein HK098_000167 [Nowakowskiella sp. JEL0407]
MIFSLTILVIIAIMGIFGFTEGILAGIVLACFFFDEVLSGQVTVEQTCGLQFIGFIANKVDVTIQELLHGSEKVRFVVLDFSLISGIDYSAVEAFLRIKRKLMEQNIHFVFSGLGDVTADLVKSGIFDTTSDTSTLVHNFEDLNGALEWCENVLLATYFKQRSRQSIGPQIPQVPHGVLETGTREIQIGKHDPEPSPSLSIFTPRERDVYQAAYFALEGNKSPLPTSQYHPVHVLMNAVSESGHIDPELEYVFAMFERVELVPHHLIWSPGESANELFVVDTGELILYSEGEDGSPDRVIETLLGGTMVGELEMFSNRPRTSRLRSGPHGHAVVWRLSLRSFEELERTHPKLAMKFVRLALEFDSERLYNVVQHATALWGIQTEIVQSKTASHKMRSQQELQKLTVADLKAVQTGVKADLIKRILEHEAKQQTTATASKPAPPEITTTTAPSNGSTLAKAVSQPANSNLTVDGSAGTPANTPIVTTAPDMPAENKVNDDSAMKKARAERFGVPFVDPDEQAEKRKLREMKFGISSKETLQEQEEAAKKRRIEKFGLTSPTLAAIQLKRSRAVCALNYNTPHAVIDCLLRFVPLYLVTHLTMGASQSTVKLLLAPLSEYTYLPVFDEKYCSDSPVSYTVQDKGWCFETKSYQVFDESGALKFNTEKKPFSWKGVKTIHTATGEILCGFERIPFKLRESWIVYLGPEKTNFCTFNEGRFLSSDALTVTIPGYRYTSRSKEEDELNFEKNDLKVEENEGATEAVIFNFVMVAGYGEKKAKIFLGEDKQIAIAELQKSKGQFHLKIAPGVDSAFIILYCIILEELHKVRESRKEGGGG